MARRLFSTKLKPDHYLTLQVSKQASELDIKHSFYALAKQYHPDVNKAHGDKFKVINEAYEILSDSKLRAQYDQTCGIKTKTWTKPATKTDFQHEWYKSQERTMKQHGFKQKQYQAQPPVQSYALPPFIMVSVVFGLIYVQFSFKERNAKVE